MHKLKLLSVFLFALVACITGCGLGGDNGISKSACEDATKAIIEWNVKYNENVKDKDKYIVITSDGFSPYIDHASYAYSVKEYGFSAYTITPEQMNEINQARLDLQKKMEYKIDNIEILDYQENKNYMADVTVKIKVIDSALMEKQVEDFIRKEAPKRIPNYKEGELFNIRRDVRPNDNKRILVGKLLTDAVLYSLDNPIFKEEMTPVHFIYRDYEDGKVILDLDSSLEIDRKNTFDMIERLFWNNIEDGSTHNQNMFFDQKLFDETIKSKAI